MRSRTKKLILSAIFGGVVVAALIVGLGLNSHPGGTLNVKAYESTWQTRVDGLLKGRQSAPSSCWTLSGTQGYLRGFGNVNSYCWTSVPGHRVNLRFIRVTTTGAQELLYMPESNDWKRQYGFCVVQLSGPWWQLMSTTERCPDGFTRVVAKRTD